MMRNRQRSLLSERSSGPTHVEPPCVLLNNGARSLTLKRWEYFFFANTVTVVSGSDSFSPCDSVRDFFFFPVEVIAMLTDDDGAALAPVVCLSIVSGESPPNKQQSIVNSYRFPVLWMRWFDSCKLETEGLQVTLSKLFYRRSANYFQQYWISQNSHYSLVLIPAEKKLLVVASMGKSATASLSDRGKRWYGTQRCYVCHRLAGRGSEQEGTLSGGEVTRWECKKSRCNRAPRVRGEARTAVPPNDI